MKLSAQLKNPSVITRSGTSKKGKAYSMRFQSFLVSLPSGEIRSYEYNLDEQQAPYPAGQYEMDISNILTLGSYGFEFKRFENPTLYPLTAESKPLNFGKTGS